MQVTFYFVSNVFDTYLTPEILTFLKCQSLPIWCGKQERHRNLSKKKNGKHIFTKTVESRHLRFKTAGGEIWLSEENYSLEQSMLMLETKNFRRNFKNRSESLFTWRVVSNVCSYCRTLSATRIHTNLLWAGRRPLWVDSRCELGSRTTGFISSELQSSPSRWFSLSEEPYFLWHSLGDVVLTAAVQEGCWVLQGRKGKCL